MLEFDNQLRSQSEDVRAESGAQGHLARELLSPFELTGDSESARLGEQYSGLWLIPHLHIDENTQHPRHEW